MQKQLSEAEIMKNHDTFWNLVNQIQGQRLSKITKLFESKFGNSYFMAPASSKTEFHNCFVGGLLAHSLNVVKNLKKLTTTVATKKYPDESIIIAGLFHDLGKAGDGENEYYTPNKSDWHIKNGILFEINKNCLYLPTSERGLFVLQKNGIELSSDEYLAIRLNDGQYDETNKSYKMKEPEFALLTHWADMLSVKQEKSL